MNPRNIVMVTADSLRADYCHTTVGGYETTPNLDRLADNAVTFDNAISPGPRTASSIPEIITGEPIPHTDPIEKADRIPAIQYMLKENESLPERLGESGYTTIAVTANPWTTVKTDFGDVFDVIYEEGEYRKPKIRKLLPSSTARKAVDLIYQYRKNMHWFIQWPDFYDDIIDAVEQVDEPYFLWVFLLDTHNPYIVPRQDRRESSTLGMYYSQLRSNRIHTNDDDQTSVKSKMSAGTESMLKEGYRDCVRSVDRFVDTLLTDLVSDDPVLIFNSDHGEAFDEHGTYGHQSVVYEENIHVPFIVYNSGDTGSVQAPVSLRRLPDMICEFVRNGVSFSDDRWDSDYVVSRAQLSGMTAVRGTDWKYLSDGNEEYLFNIQEDPFEKIDESESNPDKVRVMREYLEAFLSRIDENTAAFERGDEIEQDTKDRLESLGYVME